MLSKGFDRPAGFGVERVNEVVDGGEDAWVRSVGPVDEAAVGAVAVETGGPLPEELAGGGVDGHGLVFGGDAVEDAVEDDGLGLGGALAIGGVVAPDFGELGDVGLGDLLERGVAGVFGGAAVGGPVGGPGGLGES